MSVPAHRRCRRWSVLAQESRCLARSAPWSCCWSRASLRQRLGDREASRPSNPGRHPSAARRHAGQHRVRRLTSRSRSTSAASSPSCPPTATRRSGPARTSAFRARPQDVGLRYDYQYNVRFAGRRVRRRLLRLPQLHRDRGADLLLPAATTTSSSTTTSTSGRSTAYIDADATESWLERQSTARLGIPASQYTVFLINWYGRADFQFSQSTTTSGWSIPTPGSTTGCYDETLTRNWGGHSGRRGSTTCPPARTGTTTAMTSTMPSSTGRA